MPNQQMSCSIRTQPTVGLKASILLISCLAIVALLPNRVAAQESSWEKLNRSGQDAYQQGRFDQAEKDFSQAAKEAENSHADKRRLAAVLTNLGATFREERKYTEAESSFEKAITIGKELDPQSKAVLLRHYGSLLQRTQRLGVLQPSKEPGVLRRWDLLSQKSASLIEDPLVIVDGLRSAYVEHGKLILLSDAYQATQQYLNAGLYGLATDLEAHVKKVFGADFNNLWRAQTLEAQAQALIAQKANLAAEKVKLDTQQALMVEQQARARAEVKAEQAQARAQVAQDRAEEPQYTPAAGLPFPLYVMPGSNVQVSQPGFGYAPSYGYPNILSNPYTPTGATRSVHGRLAAQQSASTSATTLTTSTASTTSGNSSYAVRFGGR